MQKRPQKTPALILLLSIAVAVTSFAQTVPDLSTLGSPVEQAAGSAPTLAENVSQQAVLAMTTPDYLVTPGDTYLLRFTRSFTPTTLMSIVEHDYTLNLDFVGTIDTRGLTFVELQDRLEALVTDSYPGSTPHVTIRSIGRFEIEVSGDVTASGRLTVSGLTRLGEVVSKRARTSASRRTITILSADGRRRTYDYFAAERFGDADENPYVRPGDRIIFQRERRRVTLSGAVHRSGAYQLRPGDDLGDLLETYGDGVSDTGDPTRVEIRRLPPPGESTPILIEVDASTLAGGRTTLENLDIVRVPSRSERQPIVYFEGAVELPVSTAGGRSDALDSAAFERAAVEAVPGEEVQLPTEVSADQATQGEADAGSSTDGSSRTPRVVRHRLRAGETLAQAVRAMQASFLPEADYRNAELKRVGEAETRPLDLDSVLYGAAPEADLVLEPGDRILIPFGEFEVYVTGEVKRSRWVALSNLSRLEVVRGHFTPFSSERDVRVVSRDGTQRRYDLFRADRYGERGENPYLRPGDRIIVSPYDRQVQLSGQVRKPGTYQLLPGEDISNLIDDYGEGLTVNGDPTEVRVTRFKVRDDEVSKVKFVNATAVPDFPLFDQDTVNVPNRNDFLPVVFFEGAVGGGREDLGEESTSDQLRYQFRPGETLSNAVRSISNRFTPVSDLENAYMLRETVIGPIAVDLREFLYSRSLENDIRLRPLDRIVVPFRQFFVTVSGAVASPGQYPYIPDRTYEYYLGLAGGTDPGRNIGARPRIRDVSGKRRAPSDYIEPEDDIFFATNNPLAYLSPFATVVGTAVSVVSLVLTLTSN